MAQGVQLSYLLCGTLGLSSCLGGLSLWNWSFSSLFQVFHKRMPPEAIDLASRLLQYSPSLRCTAVSLFFPSCCGVLIPSSTLSLQNHWGLKFTYFKHLITSPIVFFYYRCKVYSSSCKSGLTIGYSVHWLAIVLAAVRSMYAFVFWWASGAQCSSTKWSPFASSFQL